ncbi:DMT family transporter [Streptomyces sp. NPDC023588]|uniref:EamA family transporter n=1 Tax=Streptomyces sp. NPDC023588 TaxID=3154907 RepID=UPI0033FDBA7A
MQRPIHLRKKAIRLSTTTARGIAAVGASAAGFGLLPVLALWGASTGLNVMTLLILRFALTAALLPLLMRERRPEGEREPEPLAARDLGGLFLLGVLFALQSVLYLLAVERISPGLAVLLHYIYPVFVLVLSVALRHDAAKARLVLPLAISLAGLALTVGSPGDADTVGVLCALACALVYALYVVLGTRLSERVGPQRLTLYVVLCSALSLAAVALPTGRFDLGFQPSGWAAIATIAVASTAMPIALFFVGAKILGATGASILSMLEPIVGVLAAWALLGEKVTLLQLAGGAILLTGAALSVYAPSAPAGPDGRRGTVSAPAQPRVTAARRARRGS